jgi:DNA-binding transcriptional LysR family regulator
MLETLKIFRDLVETHSFSRAAARNFITQSAVSQRIRRLEAEVGHPLVVRNRTLELTEAGRIFYDAARDVLKRYEEGLLALRAKETVVAGRVRLATVASIGLHRLPPCIKDFIRRYPDAGVDVEYRTFREIYEGVLDGSLDMGIVAGPLRHPQTAIVPLRADELVVIAPRGHAFAKLRRIDIAKLNGEPFVAFDESTPTRRLVERELHRAGVEVRIVQSLDNIETMKRAVEVGAGISIVPRCAVAREVREGTLTAAPFAEPELGRPVAIVYRKGRALNSAALKMIEVLTAEL